jgi:hypothetical protein
VKENFLMRHADAELQLWLANDRIAREQREMEMAQLVRAASASPTIRQRAGQAVIALGERLAGEAHPSRDARRLGTRAF